METIKTIKSTPMSGNFAETFKSALYSVVSLTTFAIKLTYRIIKGLFLFGKFVAGKK